MTPAERAKAIEDAALTFADAAMASGVITQRSESWQKLLDAIRAAVGAAPDSDLPTYTDDLELRYVEVCEERDHLRQLLPREGWQIVPVVPTQKMRGILQWFDRGSPKQIDEGWKEVLAASPKP